MKDTLNAESDHLREKIQEQKSLIASLSDANKELKKKNASLEKHLEKELESAAVNQKQILDLKSRLQLSETATKRLTMELSILDAEKKRLEKV